MKRFLSRFLLACSLMMTGYSFYLYLHQESLIFIPSSLPKEHPFCMSLPCEEIFYEVENGISLSALRFPVEQRKGAVLCFHGRGVHLGRDWGRTAARFNRMGYDFIVYDYRGFGKSDGKIDTFNIYTDPVRVYSLVSEEYGESGIILYGHSLGTAFATFVAAHHNPKALILDSPFYSMVDAACANNPYLPRTLIELILRYPLPSYLYAPKVSCPILIFHGSEDSVVPLENGQKLYSLLDGKGKFIILEGYGHNNLPASPLYEEHLSLFESAL